MIYDCVTMSLPKVADGAPELISKSFMIRLIIFYFARWRIGICFIHLQSQKLGVIPHAFFGDFADVAQLVRATDL